MRKKSLRALPVSVRYALRTVVGTSGMLGFAVASPPRLWRTAFWSIERRSARQKTGPPGVSEGTYATVLFVLGMTDRLAELADARFDRVGLALEQERVPKRICSGSKMRSTSTGNN